MPGSRLNAVLYKRLKAEGTMAGKVENHPSTSPPNCESSPLITTSMTETVRQGDLTAKLGHNPLISLRSIFVTGLGGG
jgi:hypothetical protein